MSMPADPWKRAEYLQEAYFDLVETALRDLRRVDDYEDESGGYAASATAHATLALAIAQGLPLWGD